MDREVGQELTQDRWHGSPWSQGLSRRGFLRLASGLAAMGLLTGRERLVWALTGELQHPRDPSHPTPFEELHLPKLRIPSFTRNGAHIPIVVEMAHPMEPDHYIKSIQILNESDPVPSKGTFHLTPANGEVYLAVQARMHSGSSSVLVIAECNLHKCWAKSQPITIPEGEGGCATVTEGTQPSDDEIRPPVIRIPELVAQGRIRRGEIIRVQVKFKHPNRTGLAFREGKFFQEADPFYIRGMEVFYGDRLISWYEMTPAVSDNPFMTFKLRATENGPIRIVLTNSRGEVFQATQELVLS